MSRFPWNSCSKFLHRTVHCVLNKNPNSLTLKRRTRCAPIADMDNTEVSIVKMVPRGQKQSIKQRLKIACVLDLKHTLQGRKCRIESEAKHYRDENKLLQVMPGSSSGNLIFLK